MGMSVHGLGGSQDEWRLKNGQHWASRGPSVCIYWCRGPARECSKQGEKKKKPRVRRARDAIQSAEGLLSMREALDLILSAIHT